MKTWTIPPPKFPRSRAAGLSALLVAALLAACTTTSPAPSAAETRLLDGMVRRLTVAREVAWIKYVDGLPVRDAAREAAVLDSLAARAPRLGLPPARVVTFFRAQIDASCAEQTRWMKAWSRGAALPTYAPRNLRLDVRGDLNAIDAELLAALAALPPGAKNFGAEAESFLRRQGIGSQAARLATAPFSPGRGD